MPPAAPMMDARMLLAVPPVTASSSALSALPLKREGRSCPSEGEEPTGGLPRVRGRGPVTATMSPAAAVQSC